MKKILLMLLCGVLMLSLFACGEPKKEEPKDPPDWETLLAEYDEWATEYVNFQIAYKADPTNPVTQAILNRWPGEIAEWKEKTDEMFKELKDFPTERNAYTAELNRITKRLTDAVSNGATAEEINAFISEYDKWADEYVAFFEQYKDDQKAPEFQSGLTELLTESAEWSGKVQNMTARITDSALLANFTSEVAKITAKIAGVYN